MARRPQHVTDAEREVLRALEINPGYAPAHLVHSVVLAVTGRVDASIPAPVEHDTSKTLSFGFNARESFLILLMSTLTYGSRSILFSTRPDDCWNIRGYLSGLS